MPLNRDQLRTLIQEEGLIRNYIDLDRQLTPNGFDLSLNEVAVFSGPGQLDFTNEERELPSAEPVPRDGDWWHLQKGIYKLTANEIVDIPLDIVGVGFQRSSLLRMGAHIQNAFWEAGYKGETECLLVVDNPEGIRLKEDARIIQLGFQRMDAADNGYTGVYSMD
jgi:dUTP pyrophosphatase